MVSDFLLLNYWFTRFRHGIVDARKISNYRKNQRFAAITKSRKFSG